MAPKTRQRISYVLPLPNASAGHRLGVNSLALDEQQNTLYSAGRDGALYAWNLNSETPRSQSRSNDDSVDRALKSTYKQHVQAHSHWINDISLVNDNAALVSASSDASVRIWRPHTNSSSTVETIGLHTDYVKCLASPSPQSSWIAAGGLDRKIALWDLDGAGQIHRFDVADTDSPVKGSVYALAANGGLIASGGPESVVKLWDSRTGAMVTKLVGHTDNIRSILLSRDNEILISASSDQTLKVWSIPARRCMYNLAMHNDSIWSLYSNDPYLAVFYSGDRSGFVAKTDTRGAMDVDQSLSVALCREHEGINKIVASQDSIWAATASSSINRWLDVDTSTGVQMPESFKSHRTGTHSLRQFSISSQTTIQTTKLQENPQIPLNSVMRLPTAPFFSPTQYYHDRRRTAIMQSANARKTSTSLVENESAGFVPVRALPEETIEGQHGLIKHSLLGDRRHVLTLDNAGEIILWDLIQCIPVRAFGKQHLDDVAAKLQAQHAVPHWCTVDTRTGALTCTLDENHCFDAEIYADETAAVDDKDFKEDQRINLGKWVLRYLFAAFVAEEVRRDDQYRQLLSLNRHHQVDGVYRQGDQKLVAPQPGLNGWPDVMASSLNHNVTHLHRTDARHPSTPGISIAVANQGKPALNGNANLTKQNNYAGIGSDKSLPAPPRESGENQQDYFTTKTPETSVNQHPSATSARSPLLNGLPQENGAVTTPSEPEKSKEAKDNMLSFSKRIRSPFASKKTSRSANTEALKPAITEEKNEDSDSKESSSEDQSLEDSILGVIHKIQIEYAEHKRQSKEPIESFVTPASPTETPFLKLPPTTTLIIQEDRPDAGGSADLFESTINALGRHADALERLGPYWLGEALLRNRLPNKDVVKIPFTLEPFDGLLPRVTHDASEERLNANRMLRTKKILAYVAERLQFDPVSEDLKPEEYLELHCQNQLLPPNMTLAAIRAHIWRGGGDVALFYKANGRRKMATAAPLAEELLPTPTYQTNGAYYDKLGASKQHNGG